MSFWTWRPEQFGFQCSVFDTPENLYYAKVISVAQNVKLSLFLVLSTPGKVIVATDKGVYILVPFPLERQIQDLLASHRVEEALVLAKGARRNIPKEKFQVCPFQKPMWKLIHW